MRKISKIIIHCTATPAGRTVTVDDVDRWHRERGFRGIGAHCRGYNRDSIGVCYVGGLDNRMKPCDTRTLEQRQSLLVLLRQLIARYPGAKIYSHRDFAAKDCPCFDATEEYRSLI